MQIKRIKSKNHQNTYALLLIFCLSLFVFRALAQMLQLIQPVDFLPAFDDWHSGALPYPALVCFQLVIIIVCLQVMLNFFKGKVVPSSLKGKILLTFGAIYFLFMVGRLTIGLIYSNAHNWFLVKIPTVFHLVLASFLLIVSHYHLKFSKVSS